jgi:serine protease Do
VPINLARDVAEQLIERGEVHRPYLGIALDNVDPVDVRVYRLQSTTGAEVVHVDPRGPAAAVLEPGDVIVAVAGQPVRTVVDFQAALARLSPGATVPLRVMRGGRERELQVKLGLVRSGVRPERSTGGDEATSAGLQVVQRGTRVIIAGVQPYSSAARAGLRPGLLIVSANGEEIRSVDQLRSVLTRAQGVLSLIVEGPDTGRFIVNFEL